MLHCHILAHLVLGDSHVRRMNWRALQHASGMDCQLDGRGGATSDDLATAVEASEPINCDVLTLVVGTNDIRRYKKLYFANLCHTLNDTIHYTPFYFI